MKSAMQKGQTLIMLLIFIIIAVTITSAATVVILLGTKSTGELEMGTVTYAVAESGAENAILRLLRNPAYAGETITVGAGTATITLNPPGSDPRVITSVGSFGNFKRTIQVSTTYISNTFTISSWKEI